MKFRKSILVARFVIWLDLAFWPFFDFSKLLIFQNQQKSWSWNLMKIFKDTVVSNIKNLACLNSFNSFKVL